MKQLIWLLIVAFYTPIIAFAQPNTPICNQNGDWKQVKIVTSPEQHAGFVSCVYAMPHNAAIIFAGSHSGGLWKTTNGGINWRCVTDSLRLAGLGVNCVVADPKNPNIMYLAAGNSVGFYQNFGIGVLKSTDGGEHWTTTGLTWNAYYGSVATKVIINEQNPDIVYAISREKIFGTTNGGTNWTTLLDISGSPDGFYDIRFIPNTPYIVAATKVPTGSYPTGARIYVTTDRGKNWANISPNKTNVVQPNKLHFYTNRYYIATTKSSPNKIFAIFKDYDFAYKLYGTPFLSYDIADTTPQWQIINANAVSAGLDGNDAVFEISDSNAAIIYTGKVSLTKSVNAGLVFQQVYNTLHVDVRALQLYGTSNNGTNDTLFVGNDGGVGRSFDGGKTWESLNGLDLIVTEFFDIATSSIHPNLVAGGTQDNGFLRYDNGETQHLGTGDGGHTVIDWSNANQIFFKDNWSKGLVCKSIDRGNSIANNIETIQNGLNFDDFLLTQHPQKANLLYLAKDNVFEIIDHTLPDEQNPLLLYNFTDKDSIEIDKKRHKIQLFDARAIAVATSNPNVIYLAAIVKYGKQWESINALFGSKDGGKTWHFLSKSYYQINTITIDPKNEQRLWIGFGGMDRVDDVGMEANGEHRIAVSSNGGKMFNDEVSKSNGLPLFAVNMLIYERGSNDVLYAGTDAGVFRYDVATNTWVCFNHNLPVCIVSDLEIDYCKRQLYAGTFGRGVWQTPLSAINHNAPEWINKTSVIGVGTIVNAANDIRIKQGQDLIVEGTLNMAAETSIIIEKNARLIVSGGTVTNLCGDTWQGVKILDANNTKRNKIVIEKNGGRVVNY